MGDAMKDGVGLAVRAARGIAVLALAVLGVPSGAEEKRNLAAGPRYEAGAVHRFFFGSGYRDLWAAPIPVAVLDLASWSGGLVPEKKGGGKQTKSLTLEGEDVAVIELR